MGKAPRKKPPGLSAIEEGGEEGGDEDPDFSECDSMTMLGDPVIIIVNGEHYLNGDFGIALSEICGYCGVALEGGRCKVLLKSDNRSNAKISGFSCPCFDSNYTSRPSPRRRKHRVRMLPCSARRTHPRGYRPFSSSAIALLILGARTATWTRPR
jgi:hypothetical protein